MAGPAFLSAAGPPSVRGGPQLAISGWMVKVTGG